MKLNNQVCHIIQAVRQEQLIAAETHRARRRAARFVPETPQRIVLYLHFTQIMFNKGHCNTMELSLNIIFSLIPR